MKGTYTVAHTGAEFQLEAPEKPTTTVVIFLPGISGGAFTPRFQPIVDACLQAQFAIARINAWKDSADVESKTLGDIQQVITSVITTLHQIGYTQIFAIGKSFGGGILLANTSSYISKKVLWAPAIGVVEVGENVSTYMTTKLGSLKSLLDLHVDAAFLEKVTMPTLIIHGTADTVIPITNSEKLVSMAACMKFCSIDGADHSFKVKEHEDMLIKATVQFFLGK